MIYHLILHSIQSAIRGGIVRGGLAVKILMGFLALYFLLMAAVLSFFLVGLGQDAAGDEVTLIELSSRFVVYYFLSDLMLRFFFQSLSGVKIEHYILLPVSYKKLIHFMLGRSLFNYFNLLSLIVIVPFALFAILPEMGAYKAIVWLLGLLALMMTNSLFAVYLKLRFAGNLWVALSMMIALLLIGSTEVMQGTSLATSIWSEWLFGNILSAPWSAVLWVLPVVFYALNQRYLAINRYAESQRLSASSDGGIWSHLEWQGQGRVSALMANEWKLILRHKRSRTILLMSLLFLGYGMIFYNTEKMGSFMLVFAGIFITGFGAISYGQFLGGWEGRYFDGIWSRNISVEDYYQAKFRLLSAIIGVFYLLSLGYVLMDTKYFFLHTACAIFNIGFGNYVLMFFSTYQRKALDLNAGSAFNYQGTSAMQFLLMLPVLAIPTFLFFAVNLFYSEMVGFAVIGAVGLMSMAMHKLWIKGIADNFREKKHAMATAFRKKE